ncbi:hypothetical protein GQ457_09G029700 [Hibiscus cannabinus]
MADAIVNLAVERISDLLINEALFLKDVKNQVGSLKAELKRMLCFLEDVDRLPEQDKRLRNRVSEIRDLALDAEDVIDSFILEAANGHAHQRGFRGVGKRFTSIFTKPPHLHKIGVQVKEIQTNLETISKSLPAYGIPGDGAGSSSVPSMQQRLRRTFSHVEEEDVVSLEVSTKDVLALLMTEEDRSHAVVSIVGMGGIGKTTLARKLYNHLDVKRRFDCLAWVSISQQCNPREVLLSVLMKVFSPSTNERELIEKENEKDLTRRLFNVLKQKRYLIVLDDIWRIDDWDILKPAFSRGRKGSKILFTTRIKDVALRADPCNTPIELPFLTHDESWKLFIRKAFPRNKTDSRACPQAFEKLGREMVKKCGGLPLAIVVLGGLLASKQTQGQWEMVHRSIWKGFQVQPQGQEYSAVNAILALSYNDLPYQLKPCFLYLSHYPEDWEIPKKDLIRLWIAEGFISSSLESRDVLMEDVGEHFFEELVNRSLVQVGRQDYTGTNAKTCRIHDLLRDLCIEKAREENFLEVVVPQSTESSVTLAEPMLRRIAIHPSKRSVCVKGEHQKVRSLLLFQNEAHAGIDLEISECKNFKTLRVLSLGRMDDGETGEWHVSSEIGNLRHLRYLKITGRAIFLPSSIGRLKSLHTLHLVFSGYIDIPDVVSELERLRHIVLLNAKPSFRIGGGLRYCPRFLPKNLETLKHIRVHAKLIENNAVAGWTNLQSLGLVFDRAQDVKPILISLRELQRLALLSMTFWMGSIPSYRDLEPLSQCQGLSKLRLEGEITEDPQGSHHVLKCLPPCIVKLTLTSCFMKQDPMGVLEKLPCLRVLILEYNAYKGSKMFCSANGFPQLHSLQLKNLGLEEWEIEEGAMPHLQSLCLKYISELKMIPEGLRYITTLQQLELREMGNSFNQRIENKDGKVGQDFYKVSHIPNIQIK